MKTLIVNEINAWKSRREENEFWKTHTSASWDQIDEWLRRPRSLGENAWWYIRYWPINKKNDIRQTVTHKWQMLTKEFADDDFWSFDYTFAKDMDKKFSYMAWHLNGYPNEFSDDPSPFGEVGNGDFVGGGIDAWRGVILEIRNGFRAYHIWQDRDWNGARSSEFYHEEYQDVMKKLERSFDLMKKWYPHFWD